MEVVVVAAGDVAGVVHAAAGVVAPSFGVAGEGPDFSLPDEVFDTEGFGVVFHPVGDVPAGFELGRGGVLADGVAEGQIAGPAERVFGAGAGARRVAGPRGVEGGSCAPRVSVMEPCGVLFVAGGCVVDGG